MQETLKKMNIKLKVLKLAENDNDKILGRNDEHEMKKHLQKFEEKNRRNPRAKV